MSNFGVCGSGGRIPDKTDNTFDNVPYDVTEKNVRTIGMRKLVYLAALNTSLAWYREEMRVLTCTSVSTKENNVDSHFLVDGPSSRAFSRVKRYKPEEDRFTRSTRSLGIFSPPSKF